MRPLLFALLLFVAAAPAEGAPRRLTVEEAIEVALTKSPRLRATELRQRGSRDAALSLGARALPSVRLFDEYQRYKDPFAISFSFPGVTAPPYTVRDADTNTFAASLDQPLLGLGHLVEDTLALRDQAAANDANLQAARQALVEAVRLSFLRYFEATALIEIARSSEAELDGQVTVAEAKLDAGVLTHADVLRVKVAAANARQQEIGAVSQARVARANLLAALGLDPADDNLELVEPTGLTGASEVLPTAAAAAAAADKRRPELLRDRLIGASAEHARKARWLSLLPEIDGEAGYLRVDGQKFAPRDSFYVGVKGTWTIWEWGASFFNARAAGKNAEAAQQDLAGDKLQVAAEVQTALAQSRAAVTAVELAEKTIDAAKEAYRVTDALVKAGSATTTDLLDAQSALTGARLNLARARYALAMERVALARATGD